MLNPGKQLVTCFAAGVLACGTAFSGERVEFKGSTTVELPKPQRTLDNARTMRSDPERPNLEGGFVAPPAVENSPLADRKARESLDKKKNWIYANPYEEHFDNKTEQFMKGEKGTALYDNKWMDSNEEKSLVQKFLEEKNQRSKDGPRKENEEKTERPAERDSPRENLFGDRDETDPKTETKGFLSDRKNQFDSPIFKAGASESFSPSTLDRKLDKQSIIDIPFGPSRSSGLVDKDEMRQQQAAHAKEFDQILQTRLGSGSVGLGKIDALTPASEIGRLDFNSGSRRSDQMGGNLSRPFGGTGSSVTFTDGGASFGARPSLDVGAPSAGFGFGGQIKSPGLAPSLAPAPVSQTPAFSPAPFNLPFPQRKF